MVFMRHWGLSNLSDIPAFAFLALLWLKTFNLNGDRLLANLYVLAGLVLFAISTEFLQSFVPGRSASFMDFGLNVIGILFGFLIIRLFGKYNLKIFRQDLQDWLDKNKSRKNIETRTRPPRFVSLARTAGRWTQITQIYESFLSMRIRSFRVQKIQSTFFRHCQYHNVWITFHIHSPQTAEGQTIKTSVPVSVWLPALPAPLCPVECGAYSSGVGRNYRTGVQFSKKRAQRI